jgi:glucose 1-dehydrogenase
MKEKLRKTALVTGGSRGIGRGIAMALAEDGFDLAISHWNDHDNAQQATTIIQEQFGCRCYVFDGNLEQPAVPFQLAEAAIEALGSVDVLVNNAGVTLFQEFVSMGVQDIDRLFALDFRAPLLLMQTIGKHMMECSIPGSIVNITSIRAERAYPKDGVYGGIKAALARATQSIALEYAAYGIRVNCIAPGAIETNDARAAYYEKLGRNIPLNRPGTPADIGRAVAWLASEQSSYITGTTVRVDGGLILPGMPEEMDAEGNIIWSRPTSTKRTQGGE